MWTPPSTKKVVIFQPRVPNYRVPFFELLIQIGLLDGIQYEIYAIGETSDIRGDEARDRTWLVRLPAKRIKIGVRELVIFRSKKQRRGADLVIAEHTIRNLPIYQWLYFRKLNRFAFWGHGRTYTQSKLTVEERVKERLAKKADWFFAYTPGGAFAIKKLGFSGKRVTTLNNTIDTQEILHHEGLVTENDIIDFRSKLQINTGPVSVFIGALDKTKRIDFLLDAVKLISDEIPNFQLLVFGDGVQRPIIQDSILSAVIYGGKANTRTKALLSRVANSILMPGRVGLVAVDSFAMGLPIVTTKWPYHAPEFEYLRDGYNAVITEDNLEYYSQAVIDLLKSPERISFLKEGLQVSLDLYGIDNMVSNFHQGVLEALKLPSRGKK